MNTRKNKPVSFCEILKRSAILFALTFCSIAPLFALKTIPLKVEPPFWWAGMNNPELQLLVYGENISETKPVVDYPGVSLMKTTKLESANYLFIDLRIDKTAKPGNFDITFVNEKRKEVSNYNFQLFERIKGSASRQGFNSSDAIYLVMPDRFSNGNPGNDSVPGLTEGSDRSKPSGRHGGDIQGIENHLDYISELGFTAVWFNPLLENNMPAYSYHGYSITDFYKVDGRYGSNQDYKNLVETMHKKNLKVIMDMIFNHCGNKHYWINDLPSQDWINQFPEYTKSNFRAGTVFDPHASDYDRNIFQKGWFDTMMPDLNQNNKYLSNYLIQNSIWWIEYAGLDGIRMDTYPYPEKEAMADWARRVREEYPNFSMVGEAWLPQPALVAPWSDNPAIKTDYKSYLPYVFDFPMYDGFRMAFNEKDSWGDGIVKMYDILAQDYVYGENPKIVIFADNHDGDRIFTKLQEKMDRFKLAMTFLLTTRGVPQIYYGSEIVMTGYENRGHGDIRKDFPGGWANDSRNAFTPAGRTDPENEAFNHIKTLLNYRKTKTALHEGQLKHFIPVDGVYVYFRYDDAGNVMVILNNSDQERSFDQKRYAEMIKGVSSGKDVLTGKSIEFSGLKIPAKSSLVVELK